MKKTWQGKFDPKTFVIQKFFAWTCNGCSTGPLTDYINNPVYQELIEEYEYDCDKGDERAYLDLWANWGYTEEAEKLERNDSKINLAILL